MKQQLDTTTIANGLRAERRGTVRATAGYFGALQVLADVEAQFRRPDSDDRTMSAPRTAGPLKAMATKLPQDLQGWIEARKRFRLSHAQVQMARELGMNPRKLGKLDNHDQEPWKAPLPQFIEHLYLKTFGRERPAVVLSVEERARVTSAKRAARKEARRRARAQGEGRPSGA